MGLSWREQALHCLLIADPQAKALAVRALDSAQGVSGAEQHLAEPPGLPGRPARPELVVPALLKPRPVNTLPGRVALLHAVAHIEFNAVKLVYNEERPAGWL